MKKIRIGNDIPIQWYLRINDGSVKLSSVDVKIGIRKPGSEIVYPEFKIINECITLTFHGFRQKDIGNYNITAYINYMKPNMATVDYCNVFKLVQCSCDSDIVSYPVIIESDLQMCVDGYIPTPPTPDEPTDTKVDSISVTSTLDTIYVGSTVKGTAQMSASVSPDNATNKEVEWSSNNESIATVDANGLVTAKAAGQVTIIATAKDGSGVKGEKQLTVAANSVVSTSEPIYGTPTITATYTEIEADGSNNATPTVTYKQTAEVTDTYADGSTQKRSLSNVTTGGTVTYTKKSGTATVGTDGKVTASASTSTSKHSVAVVTVSVTLNGKVGTKDVTVNQKAYVAPAPKYYYGLTNTLPADMTSLPEGAVAKEKPLNGNLQIVGNGINNVWYFIIPQGTVITSVTESGEAAPMTWFVSTKQEQTIDVNGVTYDVYAQKRAVGKYGTAYEVSINI